MVWLWRPLYESLPYYYIVIGLLGLALSFYLNTWYWPTICAVVGLASLVAGLVLWLKRRGYRQSRSRRPVDDSSQG